MSEAEEPNHATLIFLALPTTILLGLDTIAVTPSAHFLGITQIPSGWHFLYGGANAVLSTRSGYWVYIPEAPAHAPWLRIFHWDAASEVLEVTGSAADHREWRTRLKDASNREVHGRLLPYRIDPSTLSATAPAQMDSPPPSVDFEPLTSHVTASLLNHVTMQTQRLESGLWLVATSSSAPQDRDDIPGLTDGDRTFSRRGAPGAVLGEERELAFVGINLKQTWREGAVGRERTIDARDRSGALERVVQSIDWADAGDEEERADDEDSSSSSSNDDDDDDNENENGAHTSHSRSRIWGEPILGEMQVCFLMVLLLANWSCLEEWKRVLELVLTSRDLVPAQPAFFARFLRILHAQLQRCGDVEGGLFDVAGEGAGFLKTVLRQFRRTLLELGGGDDDASKPAAARLRAVQTEMQRLEEWLHDEWNWDVAREGLLRRGMVDLEDGDRVEVEMDGFDADEETGEYAPVIVELDDS